MLFIFQPMVFQAWSEHYKTTSLKHSSKVSVQLKLKVLIRSWYMFKSQNLPKDDVWNGDKKKGEDQ